MTGVFQFSKPLQRFAGAVFVLSTTLIAAPRIEIDGEKKFDAGTINETEVDDKVTHTFTIKNTGNEPLKISQVSAGCGCTVVDYDSLIPPGGTGKVTQSIESSSLHNGKFGKGITLHSNAKNEPRLKLSISGIFSETIAVKPHYIRLNKKNESAVITLKTHKPDMRITAVDFEPRKKNDNSWASTLPVPIDFNVSVSDTPDEDGRYEYTLTVSFNAKYDERRYGFLNIETTHPEKPIVSVRGALN